MNNIYSLAFALNQLNVSTPKLEPAVRFATRSVKARPFSIHFLFKKHQLVIQTADDNTSADSSQEVFVLTTDNASGHVIQIDSKRGSLEVSAELYPQNLSQLTEDQLMMLRIVTFLRDFDGKSEQHNKKQFVLFSDEKGRYSLEVTMTEADHSIYKINIVDVQSKPNTVELKVSVNGSAGLKTMNLDKLIDMIFGATAVNFNSSLTDNQSMLHLCHPLGFFNRLQYYLEESDATFVFLEPHQTWVSDSPDERSESSEQDRVLLNKKLEEDFGLRAAIMTGSNIQYKLHSLHQGKFLVGFLIFSDRSSTAEWKKELKALMAKFKIVRCVRYTAKDRIWRDLDDHEIGKQKIVDNRNESGTVANIWDAVLGVHECYAKDAYMDKNSLPVPAYYFKYHVNGFNEAMLRHQKIREYLNQPIKLD